MGSSRVTLCAAVLLAAVLGPAGAAVSGAPERPVVRAGACLTRPDTPDAGFAPAPYPSRSCAPRDPNGSRPPRTARQAHAPEPAHHGTTAQGGHGTTVHEGHGAAEPVNRGDSAPTAREASDTANRDATEHAAAVPVARAAGPSTAQAVVGLLLAATAALVVALGVLRRGRR
ncbi:hypothetical protein [Streptomyces sp. NPDC047046]|uniref:hypothetical protein n=1 Tax=Streptomyces sp. NPDC047046 TaxID=3155378 RepID=UPI0033C4224A